MIEIGNGVQQVGISLVAQIDIALKLGDELLLHAAESALAIEQVSRDEQRENAEAEKRETHRPLRGFIGVDENEWIHEQSDAARENKNDDRGKNGQVAFAPLEMIQLDSIESCHRLFPGRCPAA